MFIFTFAFISNHIDYPTFMKNRNMPANILLSICLLCCLSLCQAAAHNSSRIHFKRLSVNDGMSQSTVLALTQDHNGKIWVGTMDGLNWYDGYRFGLTEIYNPWSVLNCIDSYLQNDMVADLAICQLQHTMQD